MAHVRALAGRIGPRPAGSEEYRRAVTYVARALRESGYRVRLLPFEVTGVGRSWNVMAWWPGSGPPRVLVGGHLDTVPLAPGANDNASGVAVILELARSLAGTEDARGVRFVAFGAEERQPNGAHHLGSEALAARMGGRLQAMVSADMIGQHRPLIVGRTGVAGRRTVAAVRRAARREGVRTRERILPDVSDHGPFERAGVPSAFMWTGDEPNHHEPTDVVRHVSKRALGRAGRVLLRFLIPL